MALLLDPDTDFTDNVAMIPFANCNACGNSTLWYAKAWYWMLWYGVEKQNIVWYHTIGM